MHLLKVTMTKTATVPFAVKPGEDADEVGKGIAYIMADTDPRFGTVAFDVEVEELAARAEQAGFWVVARNTFPGWEVAIHHTDADGERRPAYFDGKEQAEQAVAEHMIALLSRVVMAHDPYTLADFAEDTSALKSMPVSVVEGVAFLENGTELGPCDY